MEESGFLTNLGFNLGPLQITPSIITTWLIMLLLIIVVWLTTRRLSQSPSIFQVILEEIITLMYNAISDVLPDQADLVFPFIASLWVFIGIANLIGVIPGLSSPTADLSVTASLAILTFAAVHWYGIRADGLKNYLLHYLRPSPLLLPFNLIGEVSRTLALAVRLFGNVMSLQFAAMLVLMIAGFLVPVPLLILHIIEAIIQAYIFGILALIYIAGGIQLQEQRKESIGEKK